MMRRLFFLTLGVSTLAASSVNASNTQYDDDFYDLAQHGGPVTAIYVTCYNHTGTRRQNGRVTHYSNTRVEVRGVTTFSEEGDDNRVHSGPSSDGNNSLLALPPATSYPLIEYPDDETDKGCGNTAARGQRDSSEAVAPETTRQSRQHIHKLLRECGVGESKKPNNGRQNKANRSVQRTPSIVRTDRERSQGARERLRRLREDL